MPLQVGIVGAGIAGLSAAIGLRRAGAEVEVFERSTFGNEVGAAISLTPNAMRVLNHWGFDRAKACAVESKQNRMVDAKSLQMVSRADMTKTIDTFGHPFDHYHRVDLHNGLRELVSQTTGEGKPARIVIGMTVVDVDCEKGIISLQDGTSVTKDFVIIADGIHSRLNCKITSQAEPLEKNGWSIYRGLVPLDQVRSSSKYPILKEIFAENVDPGRWVPVDTPMTFFFVTYPCRNNKILNIALRHITLPHEEGAEDWHAGAKLEDALKVVEKCHPALGELLGMIKPGELKVYNLMRREPFKQLFRGRAVVIGDSAETVQPTHAQGGCLPIEQAATLEIFFKSIQSPSQDEIAHLLQLYNTFMLPRVHLNQHLTDSKPGSHDSYRLKAEQICHDQQRRIDQIIQEQKARGMMERWGHFGSATGGKSLFPANVRTFGPEVQEFFWSWDVFAEATAFLAWEKQKQEWAAGAVVEEKQNGVT